MPAQAYEHQKHAAYDRFSRAELIEQNLQLQHQLDQLKWMIFGRRTERYVTPDPRQLSLGEGLAVDVRDQDDSAEGQTITYERGKAKKHRPDNCMTDSGLRFDDGVEVKTIRRLPPEIDGLDESEYDIVGTRITHRLAQRPASYVVLRYELPVVKLKSRGDLISAPATPNVLERSLADVSFLVGMLVDKFQFHLPLYRQHQRLAQAGVCLSRGTLTQLVHRTATLLKPIVDAQQRSILRSRVLAMDETPIKAGKSRKTSGKMHQGYYWPLYGDNDEIVFTYSGSRARSVIESVLSQDFRGTLLSDGYKAYASYVKQTQGLVHAQCWAHTRRKFFEAKESEPVLVDTALQAIQRLYRVEQQIREQALKSEAKRAYRLQHSLPVVNALFEWAELQLEDKALLPQDPFVKALGYLHERKTELKVFLEDPDVAIDTNHVERVLRPIPMGRKSWLFCWTEIGAQHVGVIQSLIGTCKLQGIDPYVYLTDVLQRIDRHPDKHIDELTPRLWKTGFAANPLGSDLDHAG